MKNQLNKIKCIKVVLTDVDCVLTDGGMYYTENGDVMKKFHTRDGMGVSLLRKNSIPTVIVTKEKTKFVKIWSKKMKVDKLYDGIINKESILPKICSRFNVDSKEIAYIGDDINDVGLMKLVGFSAAPFDAVESVKKLCNYVCSAKGGDGVFREIADLIIKSRGGNDQY
ncbi:3-deoxy-D-manno-octulosonate 8-phosphate phosphatase KdsC protein [Marine Group I thaumarchaeote SCGC AAA799-B03]|uniref:3-deoxy-D-manno-octulosonate 8-phosphate phosphatase KdsC protein n=1 Tax=Marine Group I thaumarchaeote SCGC AAA799-B03 TaxID=1502289 RepID=A0A087S6M0_9ARCH|nr:3-deoxy-D-manno-octulosonate 8-phosphate phosphatase KdsC protein [Marine Group I thaumarchaeote SCGC AAA799-B03]